MIEWLFVFDESSKAKSPFTINAMPIALFHAHKTTVFLQFVSWFSRKNSFSGARNHPQNGRFPPVRRLAGRHGGPRGGLPVIGAEPDDPVQMPEVTAAPEDGHAPDVPSPYAPPEPAPSLAPETTPLPRDAAMIAEDAIRKGVRPRIALFAGSAAAAGSAPGAEPPIQSVVRKSGG